MQVFGNKFYEECSNEALALRIQNGETELMSQLWVQVEKFIAMKSGQYVRQAGLNGWELKGYETDDFIQVGYTAVVSAVKYFSSAADYKFLTYLSVTLKAAFQKVMKVDKKDTGFTQRRDALDGAKSLDAPLSQESASSLCEFIVDESTEGEGSVEEIAAREASTQSLQDAINKSLVRLPEQQCRIIRERYYDGFTLEQIGARHGFSRERCRQIINQALDEMYRLRKITGLDTLFYERSRSFRQSSHRNLSKMGRATTDAERQGQNIRVRIEILTKARDECIASLERKNEIFKNATVKKNNREADTINDWLKFLNHKLHEINFHIEILKNEYSQIV